MCNYPDYLSKDMKNIFIPGDTDRKSMVIAVINFDIVEYQFELVASKKRSHIIDDSFASIYAVGDILNLIEFNKISNEYTGRFIKVEVSDIQQIDVGISIVSFRLIRE